MAHLTVHIVRHQCYALQAPGNAKATPSPVACFTLWLEHRKFMCTNIAIIHFVFGRSKQSH